MAYRHIYIEVRFLKLKNLICGEVVVILVRGECLLFQRDVLGRSSHLASQPYPG